MSKGGGQGSFAQMQEPGMSMDMSGFGGGFQQQDMPLPPQNPVMPVGNSQNFSSGIGGKGGQLAPTQDYGFPGRDEIVPLDRNPSGIASDITGFIPGGDNSSTRNNTVIGGEGLLPQLQPINQPMPGTFQPGTVMDGGGAFGSGQGRFQTQGPESLARFEENMRMNEVSGPARPDPLNGVDLNRFSGGLGSKGGRSNPYQTDGIVPPVMRGQPLPGRRQFDPIDQPIARPDPAPRRTSRYTEADYSNAEAQAREILGLPPKSGGRVYAGGTPNFDERTGEYRTGGIKPPRGPVKLQPIKMQPMPFEPVISDGPDFRPSPERMELPQPIPDYMLEDIESRGTVGPGGGTRGRTGSFRDAIREFRDEFRYQPMPRRQPPIFGPPRNFPFPMPKPPRMPPRQPPRMPGRNTQFQMPFFGSPYGRMNPYQGQFSGYGVPSNMFSFAQPHYQPYVPQAYTPPPTYTQPAPSAPPVMQLPPGQGVPTFGGGYGGIGGFGRYNLGLAGSQLR